jgi:hypothetical protein
VCSSETKADSCLAYQALCPAIFLSVGSGYTIEGLSSCADEWAVFDCDRLANGELPACVTPGTRALGQGCRFNSQCASSSCATQDPAACGKCAEDAESGDPCEIHTQCPDGHLCTFGRCLQVQVYASEDQLEAGSPCNYDGRCSGACIPTSEGDRCGAVPANGEACLTLPAAGARRCPWMSACNSAGICEAVPDEGSPCGTGLVPCSGAYCDSPTGFAPGTCKAWLEPGSACNPEVAATCGENDRCVCDDASCSSAHCTRYVPAGVACGEYRLCEAGSTCTGGVCTAASGPYQPDACAP